MRSKLTTKRITALLGVVAALAIAVGAFAYWTAGGSGSGTGTTADPGAQSVTVNQTSASSGLYPGGSVALSGNFDNANTNAVHVASVTASVTGVTDSNDVDITSTCATSNYNVTGTSSIGSSGSVPAGSGVGSWSGLTLNMTNSGSNQNACKGAKVVLGYTAS